MLSIRIGLLILLITLSQGVSLLSDLAHAAEISVEKGGILESGSVYRIWIVGEIRSGDSARFERAVASIPPNARIVVQLASPGGDIIEAIRIGHQVREGFFTTMAPNQQLEASCANNQFPSDSRLSRDQKEQNCACFSACFAVWSAGIQRLGSGSLDEKIEGLPVRGTLGVHPAPRFDARYFSELSASEAEEKYYELLDTLTTYFREMDIPDSITDRLFTVSSTNIYLLLETEVAALRSPPAISEWLKSRCGELSDTEYDDFNHLGARYEVNKISKELMASLDWKPLSREEQFYYSELDKRRTEISQCGFNAIGEEQKLRRNSK